MKKLTLLFITMILLSACMGKIRNIKLSAEDVIFTSEASSYIVSSDVEINIVSVNEDNSSFYVIPSYKSNLKYVDNWITVTINCNSILIEVTENTSGKTRTASICLMGKSDANRAGDIKVTQY